MNIYVGNLDFKVNEDEVNEMFAAYGAVSEECVREMVVGVLERSHANIAVAVTGIAGPTGGTQKKPVGLVYIAVYVRGKEPNITKCNFDGTRSQIRELTCVKAFDLLIKVVSAV